MMCSNGMLVEVIVPEEGGKSADTFEVQPAQRHLTLALPKAPGTSCSQPPSLTALLMMPTSAAWTVAEIRFRIA